MFNFLELNFRLILHNAELCYAVIHMDHSVSCCIDRHPPHIIITTISVIHDSNTVRLDQSPCLKGRTSRNKMRLISLRQFHRNTKRDQSKISCMECDLLRSAHIDPVGFTLDIIQLFYFIRKIFDSDLLHLL